LISDQKKVAAAMHDGFKSEREKQKERAMVNRELTRMAKGNSRGDSKALPSQYDYKPDPADDKVSSPITIIFESLTVYSPNARWCITLAPITSWRARSNFKKEFV
jgi:hypothetical protein